MKIIKSVKSANYHLKKLLSASAWSSLSYLTISAVRAAYNLTLNVVLFSSSKKQFPITLTGPGLPYRQARPWAD